MEIKSRELPKDAYQYFTKTVTHKTRINIQISDKKKTHFKCISCGTYYISEVLQL